MAESKVHTSDNKSHIVDGLNRAMPSPAVRYGGQFRIRCATGTDVQPAGNSSALQVLRMHFTDATLGTLCPLVPGRELLIFGLREGQLEVKEPFNRLKETFNRCEVDSWPCRLWGARMMEETFFLEPAIWWIHMPCVPLQGMQRVESAPEIRAAWCLQENSYEKKRPSLKRLRAREVPWHRHRLERRTGQFDPESGGRSGKPALSSPAKRTG